MGSGDNRLSRKIRKSRAQKKKKLRERDRKNQGKSAPSK